MSAIKPRKGRPTMPESERASVAYNVRLTAAQHAKVQRLGGAAWIRERIDKARDPAEISPSPVPPLWKQRIMSPLL